MTDEVAATPAPIGAVSEPMPTPVMAPEGTPDNISVSEAARIMRQARKPKEQPTSAEETPPAAEEQQLAPEAEPAAETPSGETEAEPEADLPPIEPPKFWKADEIERFKTLPRETQEYLVRRESERSAEIDRIQRETAEARKALEAQQQAAAQVQRQYEENVALQAQMAQASLLAEFPDVQSWDDLKKLAVEDPLRKLAFDTRLQELQMRQQEFMQVQQRRQVEASQQWDSFARRQDEIFAHEVPDADSLRDVAVDMLKGVGFTPEELAVVWSNPAIRDARMQKVLADAARWRKAQASKAKVVNKPVPPKTQRPGVSTGRSPAMEATAQALDERLNKTGNVKDAARLYAARLAGRR